ncbi:MAG: hypothetical protein DRH24_02835 [Deltaproteobacteria bacterium]|nr:MAG: hypothetical protein DRH24_02835 [Deltaproteobacteria bacterium]
MKRYAADNKGIALFLVLWVLVLLMVIVGEFCHAMKTELKITRNFKESTQAYYIARAGMNTAIIGLIEDKISPPKATSEEDEEEGTIKWRINAAIPEIPFGQGRFEIRIENQSGKVNINRAGKDLLRMMLSSFDCDDNEKDVIVDSILDWRDKDRFHRLNGAEDDYYQGLPEPYDCKDADFDSIDELLLVKGMTEKIFYDGLKDMVTVYPHNDSITINTGRRTTRRRKTDYNYNKININSASIQMLKALPLMTDDLAAEIVEYRKEKDFVSMTDLSGLLGPEVYQAVIRYITLKTSPYFIIKSIGAVEEGSVKQEVKALVKIDLKLKDRYLVLQWIKG